MWCRLVKSCVHLYSPTRLGICLTQLSIRRKQCVEQNDCLGNKTAYCLLEEAQMLLYLLPNGGWKVHRIGKWGLPQCWWLFGCSCCYTVTLMVGLLLDIETAGQDALYCPSVESSEGGRGILALFSLCRKLRCCWELLASGVVIRREGLCHVYTEKLFHSVKSCSIAGSLSPVCWLSIFADEANCSVNCKPYIETWPVL